MSNCALEGQFYNGIIGFSFVNITLCAEDCWPSSETKVTSCNSWAFPSLPSIYVQICNRCQLKECSLPLPRIYCPFHINFSVPKTNSSFQNGNEKSQRQGSRPRTKVRIHRSIHSNCANSAI